MASIYTIKVDGIERRAYFDPKILDDSLLKSYVTPEIIRESSDYIEAIAESFGISKQNIAVPTPYKISTLARYYAYMRTALLKAQFSIGKEGNKDSFALKYEQYRLMVKDYEAGLTADTFTNGIQAKRRRFPMVVPISRN